MMKTKYFFFASLALCAHHLGASPSPRSSTDPFQAGKIAFEKGSCRQVISFLRSFLANRQLLQSSKDITDSYKMLAICFVQEHDQGAAVQEIESLLFLDPETKMDPFSTPPAVLELLESTRKKIEKKRLEISHITEEVDQKKWENLGSTKRMADLSLVGSFVPLGYPQFIKGRFITALLLGVAEVSFLGINIGAYWWKKSLPMAKNPSLVVTQERMAAYNTAQIIQFSALGALVGTYLYGVVDDLLL